MTGLDYSAKAACFFLHHGRAHYTTCTVVIHGRVQSERAMAVPAHVSLANGGVAMARPSKRWCWPRPVGSPSGSAKSRSPVVPEPERVRRAHALVGGMLSSFLGFFNLHGPRNRPMSPGGIPCLETEIRVSTQTTLAIFDNRDSGTRCNVEFLRDSSQGGDLVTGCHERPGR